MTKNRIIMMLNKLEIIFLISGNGSNLQAVINAINKNIIKAKINAVISDKVNAYGLIRAKKSGISALYFDKKKVFSKNLSDEILDCIHSNYPNTNLIVLAGFLSILEGDILKEFSGRIINIHPALIPSFCGKGMYGLHVHEAAIQKGVKVSGCTVHLVNGTIDGGPILIQKTVKVNENDTPVSLQKKILKKEHKALVEAITLFG